MSKLVKIDPQKPVALLSCYDKVGLDTFAPVLVNTYGYQLLSTGGTAEYLRSLGLSVIETTELTGFKELAGGRVKSLHPTLFAGILDPRDPNALPEARPDFWIDLVVANVYPYEAMKNAGKTDLTEYIDVGGPSLLRAAAKNHAWVTALCQPNQYQACLQELNLGEGKTSLSYRQHLAGKVFAHTAAYDAAIASVFSAQTSSTKPPATLNESSLPAVLPFTLHQCQPLRYGENPQQAASLYTLNSAHTDETGFDLLQGKPLSYNNLLDAFAAWNLIQEFEQDTPACAIIKHNNPCGVALGNTLLDAWERALSVDSLSAFGGIVAVNQPVTKAVAKGLTSLFLELVIAPKVTEEALAVFSTKPNVRVITRPWEAPLAQWDIRVLDNERVLVQQTSSANTHLQDDADTSDDESLEWQVVTETHPTPQQWDDLNLAWKVAKHVKSNAMVLANNGRTVGLGVGQTSRIGALEIALRQACDDATGAVLASDGFIPALDNVHAAIQGRVAAIVQPGGSVKDADVIALANTHHIAMVTTGVRVFRH